MDLLVELLEDPAYRHVLLNHLPIVGLGVAWIVLAWSAFDGRWSSTVFALALVALFSGSSFGVISAGDEAYPFVFDSLDGPGREWLDYHTHLGDRWGWVLYANGALAAAGIALGALQEPARRIVGIVLLLTTLVGLGTAALIAEAGGKIRHPEFRLSDPPTYDAPGRIR